MTRFRSATARQVCTCSTSMIGRCDVHGEIDFSETTYSKRNGWTDEHGATVSPPPPDKCRYCLDGICEFHPPSLRYGAADLSRRSSVGA